MSNSNEVDIEQSFRDFVPRRNTAGPAQPVIRPSGIDFSRSDEVATQMLDMTFTEMMEMAEAIGGRLNATPIETALALRDWAVDRKSSQ